MSSFVVSCKTLPPRPSETDPLPPSTTTSSADYTLRRQDRTVARNAHRTPVRCSLGPRAELTAFQRQVAASVERFLAPLWKGWTGATMARHFDHWIVSCSAP